MLRQERTQLTAVPEVLDDIPRVTADLGEKDVALADLFQVLASPIRLGVVRLLLNRERYVGDLIAEMGIAQPRLSNHLACLRNCGLVRTRRQGNFVYYAIADPRVVEIVQMGAALAESNAQELAHCEVLEQER
jgi:DNA-binding transcriptional ArsR family regulator